MATNIISRASLARAAIGLFIGLFTTSAALAETVLVTGANRGIGLEFCKQYAAKGWNVIATYRREEIPETLTALASEYPELVSVEPDGRNKLKSNSRRCEQVRRPTHRSLDQQRRHSQ